MPAIQQTPIQVPQGGPSMATPEMTGLLQQLSALQTAPQPTPPDVTSEMADSQMAHSASVNDALASTTPKTDVSLHEPLGSKISRAAKALSSGYDLGAMSPEQRQRVMELQQARSDQGDRESRAESHQRVQEQQTQQRLDLEKETAYHARRLEDAKAEIQGKMADIDTQIKSYQLQVAKETDPIKRNKMLEDIKHQQYLRDVYLPGELHAKETEAQATATRANILKKAAGGRGAGYSEDVTETIPGTNTPISQKHVERRPLPDNSTPENRPPLSNFEQH